MPKTLVKPEYRTFLSLGELGEKLENYADSDPRFKTRSAAAKHLIELGMKHDAKARAKALDKIRV